MSAQSPLPSPLVDSEVVFITGMSGSGKSVALHALEDSGFYCVDNLPPELVLAFIDLQLPGPAAQSIAIAIDVRSARSLPMVPKVIAGLKARHVRAKLLFLDATDETLGLRFSETRRLHPLSKVQACEGAADPAPLPLGEAIALERTLLQPLREQEQVHLIDTSRIQSAQLQSLIKDVCVRGGASHGFGQGTGEAPLILVFESFAFRRGVPLDADFVFDVRMLPNPHYEPALKPLTGRDAAVASFLAAAPEVGLMLGQVSVFLRQWLPALAANHRAYVTVAIGCTGGQHRSVYLVEQLAQQFSPQWAVLKRHRELGL